MDESRARAIAAEVISGWQAEHDRIAGLKRAADLPVTEYDIVITDVSRISRTWCVFYNTRRYIETGEFPYALGGNGPILVSDRGRTGMAGSAHPVSRYVAEFESQEGG